METNELIQKIYTMCLDDGGEFANEVIAVIEAYEGRRSEP